MPSYNIILNSNNKIDGTNSSCNYTIDWRFIPQGEYMVSFSYMGANNALATGRYATVLCELGQNTSFTTSSTNTQANSSKIIGCLYPLYVSSISNAGM